MATSTPGTDVTVLEPPGPGLGRVRLVGFPDSDGWTTWRSDLPVTTRTYASAIATPLHAGGSTGQQIVGAVYDSDDRLICDTQRGKQNRAWGHNPSRLTSGGGDGSHPAAVRLPGRTFFAGHRRDIFGHFLLETLPRLWPDLDYGAFDSFLYYPTRLGRRSTSARLPSYAVDLLAALGADRPGGYVLTDRHVVVEELVVSTPAFRLKEGYSRCAGDAFQRAAARLVARARSTDGERARRVYLSRSRLGEHYRSAENEPAVERLARGLGFTVVHPQELPIGAQVALLYCADVVAGCDGSALHLGAFARPGTVLVGLDSRLVVNQLMVDQLAGLDAVHARVDDTELHGRRASWVADLERVRYAFELAGAA